MRKPVSIKNKSVTDYWHEFYVNERMCSLCGNHGIIDTTGIKNPAGFEVGRKNFCICPNGQQIRTHYIKETNNRNVIPD